MAIEVNTEGDTDISRESGAFAAVRPDEVPEPLPTDAEFVEYKGKAQYRRITAEQWEAAGVEEQGETFWNSANNFKLPVDRFNPKALQALRNDGSFSVPAAE